MAQKALVKNKHDFLVSCRSKSERQWMQAKVLQLKREWRALRPHRNRLGL